MRVWAGCSVDGVLPALTTGALPPTHFYGKNIILCDQFGIHGYALSSKHSEFESPEVTRSHVSTVSEEGNVCLGLADLAVNVERMSSLCGAMSSG